MEPEAVATAPARKTVRPERAAVVMAANGMISGEARALAEHALGEHPAMLLQRFRDAGPFAISRRCHTPARLRDVLLSDRHDLLAHCDQAALAICLRTIVSAASLGSAASVKPSSRNMSSIGLFSCKTSPNSSPMPASNATSSSRVISRCPTPRPFQSLRTATAYSARNRSG